MTVLDRDNGTSLAVTHLLFKKKIGALEERKTGEKKCFWIIVLVRMLPPMVNVVTLVLAYFTKWVLTFRWFCESDFYEQHVQQYLADICHLEDSWTNIYKNAACTLIFTCANIFHDNLHPDCTFCHKLPWNPTHIRLARDLYCLHFSLLSDWYIL